MDGVVNSGLSEPLIELLANYQQTAEVIGNIYDTPELLQGDTNDAQTNT